MQTKEDTLAILSALLIVAACGKPEGTRYFPEPTKGERSEYSIQYIVPGGTVVNATMITRVAGEEPINGQRYWKSVSTTSGIPGAEQSIVYKRWTPSGVFRIDKADSAGSTPPEHLAIPFPLQVGIHWEEVSKFETILYKVESEEIVDLTGRTFPNCIKIRIAGKLASGESVDGWEYAAPGVGMIKQVLKSPRGTIEFTLTKDER